MVAPTFKKATDLNAGDATRYGAPDIKYAFDVLDGTHSTDRIQASVIEHNIKDYDVIVYRSGSTTYARRGVDSTLVSSSGSTPESVIQDAINAGSPGRIYIDGGTYDLTAAFTGFEIDHSFTTVTMAPDCLIRVPLGYADAIFKLNTTRHTTEGYISGTPSTLLTYGSYSSSFQQVILEGGMLADQAASTSQARSWTGIRLYASVPGTILNTIRDIWIAHCATGIELLMDDASPDTGDLRNTQWANSNLFENIWIWDAVVGVDFKVHANVTPSAGKGFNFNMFKNVTIYAGDGVSPRTDPTHGFKNIRHSNNEFMDCVVSDFNGSEITANIHSSATMTMIFGGTITALNFADAGTGTKIIDSSITGTLVDTTSVQTLTNKTLTSPTISTISNTGTVTLPTSTDTLVGRATTDTLTNKTITFANNTLTDVASLNTAQTFTTAAKTFNNNMLKLRDSDDTHSFTITTPNLAGDRTLSVPLLTGNDTLVTEAHTQTLTNKTLTSPTISTISNTGTVTLPTSTDTLVGRATTDTLTNKTIAFGSNTLTDVASLNTAQTFTTAAKTFNTGLLKLRDSDDTHSFTITTPNLAGNRDVALPLLTGNDTLVTEAHTQTLTNKTVNAIGTNSLTSTGNIAMAATQKLYLDGTAGTGNTYLHESAADTVQVVAGGAVVKEARATHALNKGYVAASDPTSTEIPDGHFTVARNTGNGNIRVWYNNGGTVSVVGASGTWDPNAAETLTNKTIAFASNTLTNVASLNTAQTFVTAAKTFNNNMLKLADSAADHVYTISAPNLAADRTLSLPLLTGNDTVVTEAHTQTLTNKTLTSPVISTISNTGTVTLPTATDTLVGRATTDTLTNKTIAYANNTVTGVAALPDVKNTGAFYGGAEVATSAAFGGFFAGNLSDTGTESSPSSLTTDGKYTIITTGVVANDKAGFRGIAGAAVTRQLKLHFKCKVKINSTTSVRMYCGIHGNGTAFLTGDDPLNALAGFMMGFTTADTNFQVLHNDSAGATTKIDVGTAKNTNINTFEVKADDANTGFQWSFNGGAFSSVITTQVPGSTDMLHPVVMIETSNTTPKNIQIYYCYMECSSS